MKYSFSRFLFGGAKKKRTLSIFLFKSFLFTIVFFFAWAKQAKDGC